MYRPTTTCNGLRFGRLPALPDPAPTRLFRGTAWVAVAAQPRGALSVAPGADVVEPGTDAPGGRGDVEIPLHAAVQIPTAMPAKSRDFFMQAPYLWMGHSRGVDTHR